MTELVPVELSLPAIKKSEGRDLLSPPIYQTLLSLSPSGFSNVGVNGRSQNETNCPHKIARWSQARGGWKLVVIAVRTTW